jgi:hypothetical protein
MYFFLLLLLRVTLATFFVCFVFFVFVWSNDGKGDGFGLVREDQAQPRRKRGHKEVNITLQSQHVEPHRRVFQSAKVRRQQLHSSKNRIGSDESTLPRRRRRQEPHERRNLVRAGLLLPTSSSSSTVEVEGSGRGEGPSKEVRNLGLAREIQRRTVEGKLHPVAPWAETPVQRERHALRRTWGGREETGSVRRGEAREQSRGTNEGLWKGRERQRRPREWRAPSS